MVVIVVQIVDIEVLLDVNSDSALKFQLLKPFKVVIQSFIDDWLILFHLNSNRYIIRDFAKN